MPDQRCDGCRFWLGNERPAHSGDRIGACRRYPPTLNNHFVASNAKGDCVQACEEAAQWESWVFAVTRANDWCGEWQAGGERNRRVSRDAADSIRLQPRAKDLLRQYNAPSDGTSVFRLVHMAKLFADGRTKEEIVRIYPVPANAPRKMEVLNFAEQHWQELIPPS